MLFSFGRIKVYYFMLISTPYSTPLEKMLYLCSTKRNQKKFVMETIFDHNVTPDEYFELNGKIPRETITIDGKVYDVILKERS